MTARDRVEEAAAAHVLERLDGQHSDTRASWFITP